MRPIFRAWDTERKKMWSAEEMGADGLCLNPDGRGFVNVSNVSTKLSQYLPHLIPLQFIGKSDVEGQKIFEGDLILIEDTYTDRILDDGSGPTEPFNHIAPVIFQGASFGVRISENGNDFDAGFWDFNKIQDQFGMTEFKIVGNIYENPELL